MTMTICVKILSEGSTWALCAPLQSSCFAAPAIPAPPPHFSVLVGHRTGQTSILSQVSLRASDLTEFAVLGYGTKVVHPVAKSIAIRLISRLRHEDCMLARGHCTCAPGAFERITGIGFATALNSAQRALIISRPR